MSREKKVSPHAYVAKVAHLEIELVGTIARMVKLGQEGRTAKQAALDERTACSVKVVAGARNQRYLPRLSCNVPLVRQ